jgi:hypothetical protein
MTISRWPTFINDSGSRALRRGLEVSEWIFQSYSARQAEATLPFPLFDSLKRFDVNPRKTVARLDRCSFMFKFFL